MIVNVVEGVIRDVSVRDHHGLQSIFLRFLANVDDVLAPDRRLVVCERDRFTAVLQCQQRHIFRRNALRTNLIGPRFRNVPVLTEKAAHVAARRAHAEDARARQKMAQRFFLDGINLQCGRRAISKAVQLSAMIGSNEAESRLAGMNMAVARTKVAVNSPARLRFPPACFVQRIGLLEDLQLFHGSPSQTPLYARWADGVSHPCWRMRCGWRPQAWRRCW